MRNVIITGGTGAIGMALIKKLLAKNIAITVLINPNSTRKNILPVHNLLTVEECDASDFMSINLNKSFDCFFHLAWKNIAQSMRNDTNAQYENILMTLQAVQLAKRCGCSCFVGAGSQAEYGLFSTPASPNSPCNSLTAYGIAKYAAGKLSAISCNQLEIKFIWLRVFSVYGSHDTKTSMISTLIEKLSKNQAMALTPCEQIWDFLHEDDCARAFYLAAIYGKNQTVYCVGSGTGLPLKHYVNQIATILQKKHLCNIGAIPYHKDQVMFLQSDISSLQKDTGFTVQISFKEGIRKIIDDLYCANN